MHYQEVHYVASYPRVQLCPTLEIPEFAFIGRSNVGKSSLINLLTGRKKLALTSGTPGKTQMINYFIIGGEWHLVDLPGYGYARVSKTQRKKWEQMIYNYLRHRPQLVTTFLLIDLNVAPQENDQEMIRWLGTHGLPFAIVFTKVDRLSPMARAAALEKYKEHLYEEWEELPPLFMTSSSKHIGRDDVLQYIHNIMDQL